jgi:TolB-like protein/DNA-binding winged helix-turn-helix (wHTH) protein
MNTPAMPVYEFGPFRMDPVKRVLLRDGEPVPLTHKVFETLLVLVQSNGQVLEKDELMKTLWPDSIVEEANLTVNISTLRKVLGERPGEHQYIVTIPGRGYCFVASVREVVENGTEVILEEETSARVVIEEEENGGVREWENGGLETIRGSRIEDRGSNGVQPAILSSRSSILGLALLIGLVAGVTYFWNAGQSKRAETAAEVKSIAVLPLKNLTDDPSEDYFSDGLTESLINELSKVRELKVIARTSVFALKGQALDAREVGRRLGVASLLEGGLRKEGETVRVTVRLVSTEDGRVIWAGDSFQRPLKEIIAVQDEVACRVAETLRGRTGRTAEARRLLEPLAQGASGQRSPYVIGCLYARIGDTEQAFAWLNKAAEQQQADLVSLKIDPAVDSLRSDPRFQDLLRRVGLP